MQTTSAKFTVTSCWSYYNKGDAAIVAATVKLINKAIKDAEITALSFDPQSFYESGNGLGGDVKVFSMPTTADSLRPLLILLNWSSYFSLQNFFGPFFLLLSLLLIRFFRHVDNNLKQALESIDDSNLVIMAGGGYLYSHVGFYVHAIPIIYSKFVRKKKIILLGHSIGPFEDFSSRTISRIILSSADLVVFREDLSRLYVEENLKIFLQNSFVSCDMALFLEAPPSAVHRVSAYANRVGITVRPWLFNEPSLYHLYLTSIEKLSLSLLEREFEIYLFPFSTVRGWEDDSEACNAIYERISIKYPKKSHLLDVKKEPPESILRILKDLKLAIFVGTRFHSVLLSSIAGIPSVVISYQHFKAHGISGQLGLSDYIIDIENMHYDELLNCVERLIDDNETVRMRLAERINGLKRASEKRIMSSLMSLL